MRLLTLSNGDRRIIVTQDGIGGPYEARYRVDRGSITPLHGRQFTTLRKLQTWADKLIATRAN